MPSSCCKKHKKWYHNKLLVSYIVGQTLVAVTPFFQQTQFIWHHFYEFFSLIWFPILLGFFIGGLVDYFIPKAYIEYLLSRPKKRTLIYALFTGLLLSTCSHGILAILIQLYKKGASISSLITLILAAPWANFPVTILLVHLFGIGGWIIIATSILIALITGLIFQYFERISFIEQSPYKSEYDAHYSPFKDFKTRIKHLTFSLEATKKAIRGTFLGMKNLANMTIWWIGIAMIMATIISSFIPHNFFYNYFNSSATGLVLTLLFATLMEVCSEGSSVLAFELYRQTEALGNVFVFLMAGVATDYTEIGLIWTNIGKRTAILLPLITLPQIIIFGIAMNYFLN